MISTLEQTKNNFQIYFCGSIRGVQSNLENYTKIVRHLQQNYGTVLTEHIIDLKLEKGKNDQEIYDDDFNNFQKSQFMIAEISAPSHGVGIELGWAMQRENYPILSLKQVNSQFKISPMISGCDKIIKKEYNEIEEAIKYIDEFIKQSFKL